jgi:hypothetical protein
VFFMNIVSYVWIAYYGYKNKSAYFVLLEIIVKPLDSLNLPVGKYEAKSRFLLHLLFAM